jgi:hypothetical protein
MNKSIHIVNRNNKINIKKLILVLENLNPSYVVLSGKKDLIDIIPNGINIIFLDDIEKNLWVTSNPENFCQNFMLKNTHKDIWYGILNEPRVDNINEAAKVCDWLIKVSEILVNSGYKLILGNFLYTALEYNYISKGIFDNLIKFVNHNNQSVKIGVKEKSPFIFQVGTQKGVNNFVQNSNKQKFLESNTLFDKNEVSLDSYILRYKWLLKRAEFIGINFLPIAQTEVVITDEILKTGIISPKEIIQNHYKTSCSNGYYTLENLYKDIFPDLTIEEAISTQIDWIIKNSQTDVCAIGRWSDDENDIQQGYRFNILKEREICDIFDITYKEKEEESYNKMNENVNVQEAGENKNEGEDYKKYISIKSNSKGTRLRLNPSFNSPTIGIIENNLTAILEEFYLDDENVLWLKIRVNNGLKNGFDGDFAVMGWVLSAAVTYTETEIKNQVPVISQSQYKNVNINFYIDTKNEHHIKLYESILKIIEAIGI